MSENQTVIKQIQIDGSISQVNVELHDGKNKFGDYYASAFIYIVEDNMTIERLTIADAHKLHHALGNAIRTAREAVNKAYQAQ